MPTFSSKSVSPEAAFQSLVVDLAHAHGWRVVTFRRVLVRRPNGSAYWATPFGGDGPGFPDLLLVRGPDVIAAELKSKRGRLEPEQKVWRDALSRTPVRWYCWKLADWDAIKEALR